MLVTTFVYINNRSKDTYNENAAIAAAGIAVLSAFYVMRFASFVLSNWNRHSIVFDFVLGDLHYHVEAID